MSRNSETTVEEKDVEIETPDGVCDAAFLCPAQGTHPGALVWADAFGLRPALRDLGRRLAAEGYAVLVPNPYYRVGAAPTLGLDTRTFDFGNSDDLARLRGFMSGVKTPGADEKDAAAFVGFHDLQKQVDTRRKIGTQGYCMGGARVFRAAASLPDRIGAGASFHGGGLVTDQLDSPHRLVPKIQAQMYVGIASNDDARQPEAKHTLRAVFAAANVAAEVDVYQGLHGWCIPDMPPHDGKPVYNQPEAETAWAKLLALYASTL